MFFEPCSEPHFLRHWHPLFRKCRFKDRFWFPFWRPFGIIFHTFYIPFSSINFKWKSHRFSIGFSLAKTKFYIVKQTVSTVFAFFEKIWKHNGFGIHFGPILGTFWHTFSILFRHRFSDAFLDAKNLEQIATWRILVGFWTKSYKPEGIRKESQTSLFPTFSGAQFRHRFLSHFG